MKKAKAPTWRFWLITCAMAPSSAMNNTTAETWMVRLWAPEVCNPTSTDTVIGTMWIRPPHWAESTRLSDR